MKTYILGTRTCEGHAPQDYIKCLKCQRLSYHLKDIAQRYCSYCHQFHEDTTTGEGSESGPDSPQETPRKESA